MATAGCIPEPEPEIVLDVDDVRLCTWAVAAINESQRDMQQLRVFRIRPVMNGRVCPTRRNLAELGNNVRVQPIHLRRSPGFSARRFLPVRARTRYLRPRASRAARRWSCAGHAVA